MPGLLRGIARTAVVAGTATVVSNRVSRRQGNRWARKDQEAAQEQEELEPQDEQDEPEADPPAAAPTMDQKLAQLRELGELKSQGVLTEAEFAEQKRRILG